MIAQKPASVVLCRPRACTIPIAACSTMCIHHSNASGMRLQNQELRVTVMLSFLSECVEGMPQKDMP